jgi:predicted nucleic acid-binding Zn ribbon protein
MGAGYRMKRPKSISGIMDEEAARPQDSAQARVMAVLNLHRIWPEIVGEMAAAHSRPAGFRQGRLTIASESPAWTQEMSLLSPQIQEKLDQALGPGVITDLRFKTAKLPRPKARGRSQGRSARPPAREGKKPSQDPPDPLLKARLEKELASVKDPELRAVLLRIRLAAER